MTHLTIGINKNVNKDKNYRTLFGLVVNSI